MCFTLNSGTDKQYGVLLCVGQTDGVFAEDCDRNYCGSSASWEKVMSVAEHCVHYSCPNTVAGAAYSLKMEAPDLSETPISISQTTRCHIPQLPLLLPSTPPLIPLSDSVSLTPVPYLQLALNSVINNSCWMQIGKGQGWLIMSQAPRPPSPDYVGWLVQWDVLVHKQLP